MQTALLYQESLLLEKREYCVIMKQITLARVIQRETIAITAIVTEKDRKNGFFILMKDKGKALCRKEMMI